MTNWGKTLLYVAIILLSIAVIVGAVALLVHMLGITSSPDDTSEETETDAPPPDTSKEETSDTVPETEETTADESDSDTVPPDTDDDMLIIEYDEPVIMYALYNVNARMKDTVESDIMGVIYQGDAVTVTGETSNRWYRVDYRGYTAYIRNDLLTADGAIAAVKIEFYDTPVTMYAVSNVNVRSNHSTNSNIYEMIAAGTSVKVTGKATNGWYRIEYGESYAYIKEEYLSDKKPEDTTPA